MFSDYDYEKMATVSEVLENKLSRATGWKKSLIEQIVCKAVLAGAHYSAWLIGEVNLDIMYNNAYADICNALDIERF